MSRISQWHTVWGWLEIHHNESVGSFMLHDDVVTIGTLPDNSLTLDVEPLAKRTAGIRRLPDGAVELADFDSFGGTYVNGRKIARHRLQDGDVIHWTSLTYPGLRLVFRPGPPDLKMHEQATRGAGRAFRRVALAAWGLAFVAAMGAVGTAIMTRHSASFVTIMAWATGLALGFGAQGAGLWRGSRLALNIATLLAGGLVLFSIGMAVVMSGLFAPWGGPAASTAPFAVLLLVLPALAWLRALLKLRAQAPPDSGG